MAKVRRIRWLSFLQGSTLSLLKLSVLFTLLWLIFRNVLSTGELIAMQFISVAILAPLQELGTIILAWREASASMANFAELMAKPVERRPPDAVPIGPIESLRFERRRVPPSRRDRERAGRRELQRGARRHDRLRRTVGLGQVDPGQAAAGPVPAGAGRGVTTTAWAPASCATTRRGARSAM